MTYNITSGTEQVSIAGFANTYIRNYDAKLRRRSGGTHNTDYVTGVVQDRYDEEDVQLAICFTDKRLGNSIPPHHRLLEIVTIGYVDLDAG